jgi:hypothetical protein
MVWHPGAGNIYAYGTSPGSVNAPPGLGQNGALTHHGTGTEYCLLNADPFPGGGAAANFSSACWIYLATLSLSDGDPRIICFQNGEYILAATLARGIVRFRAVALGSIPKRAGDIQMCY